MIDVEDRLRWRANKYRSIRKFVVGGSESDQAKAYALWHGLGEEVGRLVVAIGEASMDWTLIGSIGICSGRAARSSCVSYKHIIRAHVVGAEAGPGDPGFCKERVVGCAIYGEFGRHLVWAPSSNVAYGVLGLISMAKDLTN